MKPATTKWVCEINGKDYEVEIPNDHPGGFLYYDQPEDKLVFDERTPDKMDASRYSPLSGFKPKTALGRSQALQAQNALTLPRNRAERRRHLAAVRRIGDETDD